MTAMEVGVPWVPDVVTSGLSLVWEEQFLTPAADTAAFTAAYVTPAGSKWGYEPRMQSVGQGQYLDAQWNISAPNVTVSPASAGGSGNSLKLQTVRGPFNTPAGSIPTATPFSTGGIQSKIANGFGLRIGMVIEVRARFTNGTLGGTTLMGGNRPAIWNTDPNQNAAELDWVEAFGSNGDGSLDAATRTATDTPGDQLNVKQNHWAVHWSYGTGTGAKRYAPLEVVSDTDWHLYTLSLQDRSIKMYKDGGLILHMGDPPHDPSAFFPPYQPGVPYKWASAYQAGVFNDNGYIYPEPYDASYLAMLRLTLQVGGIWCRPLEPAALAAAAGTICFGQEVNYVRAYTGTETIVSSAIDAHEPLDGADPIDGLDLPAPPSAIDAPEALDAPAPIDD